MTKRITTAVTVLAASLILAAPTAVSSGASDDGSSTVARHKYGCC